MANYDDIFNASAQKDIGERKNRKHRANLPKHKKIMTTPSLLLS